MPLFLQLTPQSSFGELLVEILLIKNMVVINRRHRERKKKNYLSKFFGLRWLLLLIFPIGWTFTHEYFDQIPTVHEQFSQLTVISFLASSFIIYYLKSSIIQQIHLWIIYILILTGHYIKLYLVLYYQILGDSSIRAFPKSAIGWISEPQLILQSHVIATFALVGFALAVIFLYRSRKSRAKFFQEYITALQIEKNKLKLLRINKSNIFLFLIALICISSSLLYLYADLRVNAHFSQSGFGRTILKNNLAGILTYSTKILIPGLFIVLIYLADTLNQKLSFRLGIFAYLLYSLIIGFFTTSKGPIIMAVVSLLIIWILSNSFTYRRLILLFVLFSFMPLIFGLVMNLRVMREFGEIGQLSNIPMAYDMLIKNNQIQKYLFTFISRVVGYDTLPEIIDYNPTTKLKEIYHFLVNNGFHIGKFFKTEIRQYTLVGVGLAPGLLGSFYILTGSAFAVSICVILYTFFWDCIFRFVSSLILFTRPMAIAQICLINAFNTSEGTLFNLPLQLAIIAIIIFGSEIAVRGLIQRSSLR